MHGSVTEPFGICSPVVNFDTYSQEGSGDYPNEEVVHENFNYSARNPDKNTINKIQRKERKQEERKQTET